MVNHNYTMKRIRELIDIRYSKDLYLGYGKSNTYHFFYGLKRILIEIVRSLMYFFSSLRKVEVSKPELAVYSTSNQKRAISRLIEVEGRSTELVEICELSTVFCFLRFFVWSFKLVFYPVFFIASKNKEGVYFSCFTSGMVFYNLFLRRSLINRNVESLIISNDHAGDIYILSILIRGCKSIHVTYVQHGAAKREFPENYFDSIYVNSNEYLGVYKGLAQNKDVSILVLDLDVAKFSKGRLRKVDFLVCFSHQFHILAVIHLFKSINKLEGKTIRVRFHPSDRFIKAKTVFINSFSKSVTITSQEYSYKADFSSAEVIICASSSLLLDGYNDGCWGRLIWYKPIGLQWDYYNLSDKIDVLETKQELEEYLHAI